MDVTRSDLAAKKKRKKLIWVGSGIAGVAALLFLAFSLDPAAPSVDRAAIWIGEVRQGPLEVKVRGIGTLIPEDLRWITAQTNGSVEEILLLPGAKVAADTVILELSNPELEQDLRRAQLQLASAEADLANQRVREEDSLLEMEYQQAQLKASLEKARLEVDVNEELFSEGLVAERDLKRSRLDSVQLADQFEILTRRLDVRSAQMEQNLAPAIATVEQEKERVQLLSQQVDDLKVRAGIAGILQRLPLEVGQQVTAGSQLAQVADPARLKAVIRVPEIQAKDVQIGQTAEIDTRNGIVLGEVMRVNPTVEGGTVDVDVKLPGELPRGARPDLTVEGSIQLERLDNVVYMGRPAFGREYGTAGVFKVLPDGNTAVRTTVRFGRSSVSEIEVQEGLQPGDRVILSDTSQWDENDRLRIN